MASAVAEGIMEQPDNSVEFIRLNKLDIRPCQGCGGCAKTGECILKDDMKELYKKTDEADRLFFVSPIYFYAVTAQIKCYIDRCQARWSGKYLLNKSPANPNRTGHLLSCAATKGADLFTGPILTIKCLCDTLDIQWQEPLLIRSVEERSAIKNAHEQLAACRAYGVQTASIS